MCRTFFRRIDGVFSNCPTRWTRKRRVSFLKSGAARSGCVLSAASSGRSEEGSTGVPSVPPFDLEKRFSRSGRGRIFPLFSRVMHEGLMSTGRSADRLKSVLSRPIFSGPHDCAVLVNYLQVYGFARLFRWPAQALRRQWRSANGIEVEPPQSLAPQCFIDPAG